MTNHRSEIAALIAQTFVTPARDATDSASLAQDGEYPPIPTRPGWEQRYESRPWPTREQWAWIAGLFEGEGSFVARRNGTGLQVSLTSTDWDVLERLHVLTGMGNICEQRWSKQPTHWKPRWQWAITYTPEAYAFGIAVFPWLLSRRREQIREAIKTWIERARRDDVA